MMATQFDDFPADFPAEFSADYPTFSYQQHAFHDDDILFKDGVLIHNDEITALKNKLASMKIDNYQQLLQDDHSFSSRDELGESEGESISHDDYQEDEGDNDDWEWSERLRLINEFSEWSSGNDTLDKFIQQTQLETPDPGRHMQWIPYENFADIKFVKEGGYSIVYSATWLNRKEKVWNGQRKTFVEKPCIVALKSIKNSQELSQEFLDEFQRHGSLKLDGFGHVEFCHGVTRNPETNEYMFVMNFAEDGDLRSYARRNITNIRWKNAVEMLCNVAMGLVTLHKNNTFHRDLHSGNVLKFFTCNIADFGLSGPANQSENRGVYGTLPFIAPEVLAGDPFTSKADIYSFGYIMWELSSGRPPFADRPHDHTLALEICHGYREEIVPGTPLFYEKLMTRCWNANPDERPDAEEIADILLSPFQYQRRVLGLDEDNLTIVDIDDMEEFENVMNSRVSNTKIPVPNIHPFAIYTSRFLLYPNLPTPRNAEYVAKPTSSFIGVTEIVHDEEITFEEYDTHQPPPAEYSDAESENDDDDELESDEEEEDDTFVPPPPRMMGRRQSLAPPMLMASS